MSFLSAERAAIEARRIEMLSPIPAPEDAVSHDISWAFRDSWLSNTRLINAAAAETALASDFHQLKLSSDLIAGDKYSLEMSWRTPWIKFRCSKLARPSRSLLNLAEWPGRLRTRVVVSSLMTVSVSCQFKPRFQTRNPTSVSQTQ
jgi:hypothetical protein